jgi:zinc carboxypeptidase
MWRTHFEKSDGLETGPYDESIRWIEKLESRFPSLVRIETFGITPQGRKMKCAIIGKTRSPRKLNQRKKPVVLVQNVIHGGEMEGKDAWTLILREMFITRELHHLLNHLVLVLIPVFNVDGHERRATYNRPNQLGPMQPGWRTTAQNLDLNRDYMKADSPEMRALLGLFQKWLPDFVIDNHTTNGADFQYPVLYGVETHQNIHPALANWAKRDLMPWVLQTLEAQGIPSAPYNEADDLKEGIVNAPAPPRVSTGYSAVQNRFCLLVEAHSLKPYAERVHATKAMNVAVLQYLQDHAIELIERNRFADEDSVRQFCAQKEPFPIHVVLKREPETFLFRGIHSHEEISSITGSTVTRYSGEPVVFEVPFFSIGEVRETVNVPAAYYIPAEYRHYTNHLELHGVRYDTLRKTALLRAECYRFHNVSFAPWPYESHIRLNYQIERVMQQVELQPGGCIIPTPQRALRVLLHLLEPASQDSLVRWGFFNAIFERKEYAEAFIMEPIAQSMLKNDPALRSEFESNLENDQDFKDSPSDRLDFFYRRSVFFDRKEKMYPIVRLGEVPYESF